MFIVHPTGDRTIFDYAQKFRRRKKLFFSRVRSPAYPPNAKKKAGKTPAFFLRMRSCRLERFPAKWVPVRVKKTRQNKNLELGSDSIRTGL
jgi:hypothetical protein